MDKKDLKRIRTELGLTQAELAKKLGYSRQATIAEKENGKRSVSRQDEIILNYLRKELGS